MPPSPVLAAAPSRQTLAGGGLLRIRWRREEVRAMRQRGKLGLSLRYAGLYTLLYTGWLLGLLYAVHFFVLKRAGR
jgi:hypothetical protein